MRSSARSSFATASSLLFALALASCDVQARSKGPRGVILVCIDTLRADHLGCYGYGARETTPALDRLAAQSTVFADASATAGWTKPSVPSFLTGTYPCQHGVYEGSARLEAGAVTDVLPEEARPLAEVFRDAGWRTAAFVRNAQLRPGNGFEQGFDLYQDEAGDAREIRWRAQDWLDELGAEEPFFLYLHLLDVHWPYPVPDTYATRFAPAERVDPFRDDNSKALLEAINDGDRELAAEEREALIALYDGALRYADDELGRFLAYLERRGLSDEVVVSVVADHGEEFGEHGHVGHGHGLSEGLLRVPWILRVPGREPRRVEAPVSLIDLFPTLLAAASLAAPPSEGIDRLREPEAARAILAEHKAPDRYEHTLRGGGSKVLCRVRPPEAPPPADAIPVGTGERWEAEVELEGRAFHALQLKPREEEDGERLEIKGAVAHVAADRFELAGLPARLAPGAELQLAEGATDNTLAEGAFLKAKGAFQDGVFVCERLKFYDPAAERTLEIRGTVTAVSGTTAAGLVTLGPLEVRISARTSFKEAPEKKRRMEREDVVRALELGSEAARAAGFGIELEAWRVAGVEETPLEPTATGELPALLDARFAELAGRRIFAASDRVELDAEAIQRLEDLGYVR
jgi:arylsulfatase